MKKIHSLLLTGVFALIMTISANAQEKSKEAVSNEAKEKTALITQKLDLNKDEEKKMSKQVYLLLINYNNISSYKEQGNYDIDKKKIKQSFTDNISKFLDESEIEEVEEILKD